ncbi:MAG TPA: transglutaminaseTgpA domain-containing protein [Longimicrobiaceae bacterium]|nr:transglutaminaseTgpA domain-containing protein [Longimicrobiaceae bacterium]
MTVPVLHRRLAAGMALSALAAFTAGAGLSPGLLGAGAGLALALFRLPPAEWGAWTERAIRTGVLGLFAWAAYVAFVAAGDFMPAVMAMLLFLLVGETLRPLETRNDMRLYALSFALMIASTAYSPGLGFAVAFVAYVVLTTLALMTGHLRREGERFGVGGVPAGRSFLSATAALSGVTVLCSVAVFLVFPRLPRHWNVRGRPGGAAVMAGFGDPVSLAEHGGRISSNPEVAFRVEFPEGRPAAAGALHWRGRSYDRFDGTRWSRTPGIPFATLPPSTYRARWGVPLRRYRVYGGPPGARVLFGLHPVVEVRPRSAIRPVADPTGDVRFFGSDSPAYDALSAAPLPPEEALRAAPEDAEPWQAVFLQLPPLSPRVRRLADSLVAGHPTRYDQTRAVERWLREEFRYTLELPRSAEEARLESFLFRRRAGHCEYFSSAMVVLLRAAGIPARNVNGFLGGEWNEFGRYLVVTGNDAHSWVEVWFPGVGWVPFDPTPPGSRSLATEQGASWSRPALLWLDGVQYRWYKWVIGYDLEAQVAGLRRVQEWFDGGGSGGERPARDGGGLPLRDLLPWLAGAAALGVLLRGGRRGRRPLSPEARTYQALRRAYARAGYPGEEGEGPLDFVERLRREGGAGVASAERLVGLYLRARFGGEEIGEEGRTRMAEELAEARAALREARRRPRESPARSGVPAR